jgi:serine/threonine-protein kinase
VHRDFSPQNILVGVDGVTRLTDFGIAKAKSRAGYTAPGLVKGKLRYMSPEQAQGKALDRRSDVWSAGAVAWELMTGARLFDDSDEVKTVLRLVSSDPPRLSTTEAAVPEAMSEAVACALRRSLAARTASAAALAERTRAAFPGPGAVATAEQVAVWARARAETLALPRSAAISGAASTGELVAPGTRAEPVTATSSSADVRPAALGARRRPWALAGAAVIAVGSAALFIPRMDGEDPSSSVGPPSGNEATAVGTGVAPAATAALPAAASGDAVAVPPAFLELRASTDLSEVRIGRRVVAIAPPASLLTLQLLPEERGVALTIEARATDGRRATQQLAAGVGALALELGAPAEPASVAGKAAPARPRPGKAPQAKPPAARPPPLPASPYGPGGK